MDSEHIGDSDWSELQANLEATIPVYDRINRFATLGQDQRWRKGVRAQIPAGSTVLEVGCGPGKHSVMLAKEFLQEGGVLVSCDYSEKMI